MVVLKICGVLLILGAGGLSALVLIRHEKRRVAVLAGWSDLIWYIRSQVDCYLLPLPEILARADVNLFQACFCQEPHANLTAVYHASQFYLDQESKRLLSSFVREFGYGNREELLHRCDSYISSLGRLRAKRMEELPAKARIACAVCIGIAVLISILLW